MSIKETWITPDMAKELLDRNTNNRKLSAHRVNALAKAMLDNEWQYNGDTIRISKSGRLLDGQHRLSAIEKSGLAQKYILVDDLDDDSFTTIDTGSARTAGQMIAMNGGKNANVMSAASRMILMFRSFGRPIVSNAETYASVSHTSIVDFAEDNEELGESVTFSQRKWIKKFIGPSIAAFCHYEFGIYDKKARDEFFKEIEHGEFSYTDSPLRFMRDLLMVEKGSSARPDRAKRVAQLFKCFRLYRKGKTAKILRLEKDQGEWFKL